MNLIMTKIIDDETFVFSKSRFVVGSFVCFFFMCKRAR